MDKVHIALEAFGLLVALCGIVSRLLPEGSRVHSVFSKLGSLPVAAFKAAVSDADEAGK